jgi:cell division transport system permease protein
VIQSLLFVLREGFAGLARSRFAAVVATVTVAISLILIGVFLIITVNLGRLVETIKSRVELEIFLSDSFDEEDIQRLSVSIESIDGVDNLIFISKEMAIMEYDNLFKGNQDDYFQALGYNPLPASFRVQLQENYRNAAGADSVFKKIVDCDGIDAEDVVYHREYLILLEKYIKIAIAVDFIIGTIVCLSALLLVSNNIRLIIASKKSIIETMKLVGATRFFIQMPLYIQGSVLGFLGGLLAASFIWLLLNIAALEVPGLIIIDWRIYVLLINLGILLGVAGVFA